MHHGGGRHRHAGALGLGCPRRRRRRLGGRLMRGRILQHGCTRLHRPAEPGPPHCGENPPRLFRHRAPRIRQRHDRCLRGVGARRRKRAAGRPTLHVGHTNPAGAVFGGIDSAYSFRHLKWTTSAGGRGSARTRCAAARGRTEAGQPDGGLAVVQRVFAERARLRCSRHQQPSSTPPPRRPSPHVAVLCIVQPLEVGADHTLCGRADQGAVGICLAVPCPCARVLTVVCPPEMRHVSHTFTLHLKQNRVVTVRHLHSPIASRRNSLTRCDKYLQQKTRPR